MGRPDFQKRISQFVLSLYFAPSVPRRAGREDRAGYLLRVVTQAVAGLYVIVTVVALARVASAYTPKPYGKFVDLAVLAAFSLPPYLIHRRLELIRLRHRAGQCLFCGYDLTANVSGVCPECGEAITRPQPQGIPANSLPPRSPVQWVGWAAAFLAVVGSFVALLYVIYTRQYE